MDISNGTLESGPHVGAPTVWLLSFLKQADSPLVRSGTPKNCQLLCCISFWLSYYIHYSVDSKDNSC